MSHGSYLGIEDKLHNLQATYEVDSPICFQKKMEFLRYITQIEILLNELINIDRIGSDLYSYLKES